MLFEEDGEMTIDLLAACKLLLKNAWFIITGALIAGVAAYGLTYFLITPTYKSTTKLYVNNSTNDKVSTSITTSDLSASAQLVKTYAAIISSDTVLEKVIAQVGTDATAEALRKKVDVQSVNSTEVFEVSVVTTDPVLSADYANAIAIIAPSQISEIVEGSSVKVIDYAKVPTRRDGPNYKRNTLIGLLAGFVLVAGVIVMKELLDTSIRSETDLARWEYPLLSTIPELDNAKNSSGYGGYGSYSYGSYGAKSVKKEG